MAIQENANTNAMKENGTVYVIFLYYNKWRCSYYIFGVRITMQFLNQMII